MLAKASSLHSEGAPIEKSLVDPELSTEKFKLLELKQRDLRLKNARFGEESSAVSVGKLEHPVQASVVKDEGKT